MTLTLDHLVIAVRDLDRANDSYRKLFGLAPSWRGRHPAYGTANVLFRLPDTYVELLAPDPVRPADAEPPPWLRALLGHLDRAGEGLYAIALGTDDIAATVAAARERGLTVDDPADGDGVDLATGARREWTNARIDPRTTRGVRAFFIQHRSPAAALPLAQPGADPASCVSGVDHVVISSVDLDATLHLWRDVLGLGLRRTIAWSPERTLHFLRLGGTILELAGRPPPAATEQPHRDSPATGDKRSSDQQQGTSDALWGASYRVGDVARTVDRLRGAGITVSDARTGRADNTTVADLKPGFSHDVRTLFIQK
jgi:catechol 2,3-dioxygenase-like lactoylglutathione lyase family enzyme